jgi:hypothetical protein
MKTDGQKDGYELCFNEPGIRRPFTLAIENFVDRNVQRQMFENLEGFHLSYSMMFGKTVPFVVNHKTLAQIKQHTHVLRHTWTQFLTLS